MITYLAEIINMIENLGNKKMVVVKYVLQNMCKANNTLITTNRKLAKECGVSLQTVTETLKLLEGAGIITRTTGAIMVSPKLCNNWTASKEASMMIKYYEFAEQDDEQLPGQMSIEDIVGGD